MELLSIDEVKKVARLAKINLSEEEVLEYQEKLSKIIEDVSEIIDIEVDEDIMYTASSNVNCMDEDEVKESLKLEDVLLNAPHKKGSFVEVGGNYND